jgi:hypothetical protein
LLALLAALAFQPALAGVAFACGLSGHHGHDMASLAQHAHTGGSGLPPSTDAHGVAPVSHHDDGHPAGCAGCGEAGSHCCSSLFLTPAFAFPTHAPPGAREVFVDETRAVVSRPFDGPFRPPRTIPL